MAAVEKCRADGDRVTAVVLDRAGQVKSDPTRRHDESAHGGHGQEEGIYLDRVPHSVV